MTDPQRKKQELISNKYVWRPYVAWTTHWRLTLTRSLLTWVGQCVIYCPRSGNFPSKIIFKRPLLIRIGGNDLIPFMRCKKKRHMEKCKTIILHAVQFHLFGGNQHKGIRFLVVTQRNDWPQSFLRHRKEKNHRLSTQSRRRDLGPNLAGGQGFRVHFGYNDWLIQASLH